MGTNDSILELIIKMGVQGVEAAIADFKKGETAFVSASEGMTKAQKTLNAEQQRASDLESKFDAERQAAADKEYAAFEREMTARERNIAVLRKEEAARAEAVALTQEQADAEKSAADAAAVAAEKKEIERVKTEVINDYLAEQNAILREQAEIEKGSINRKRVLQGLEEARAAAIAKSNAVAAIEVDLTKKNASAYRSLDTSIREAIPHLQALRYLTRIATGILALGFVVAEWDRFTLAVKNAALEMGGFGAAAQKAYADDVKASHEAYIHFTTVAQGYRNIRQELDILATAQDASIVRQQAMATSNRGWLAGIAGGTGLLGSLITRLYNYKAAMDTVDKTQSAAHVDLLAMLDQMKTLREAERKQEDADAKATEKIADQEEKQWEARVAREEKLAAAEWERQSAQSYTYFAKQRKEDEADLAKAARTTTAALEKEDAAFRRSELNEIGAAMKGTEAAAAAKLKLSDFYTGLHDAQSHFAEQAQAESDKAREYTLNMQEKYLKHQIELHGKTAVFYHAEAAELLKVEQEKLQLHRDMRVRRIAEDQAGEEEAARKKLETEQHVKGTSASDLAAAKDATASAIQKSKDIAAQKTLDVIKQEKDAEADLAKTYKQAAIMKEEADAQSVASGAARLLGVLGHKKAEAVVEVIMHTAAGIGDLATGDFVGAALEFMSAAEYGIIAGRSGGKHGGGGGSAGTSRESAARNSGGSGRGRSNGPGVVMGESGSGKGGSGNGAHSITTINVTGGMISADTMQQFQTQAGVGQNAGLFRVNANTTSGIPAPRA